ncbi:MAG: hypothetical protein ACE5FG_15540 [Myxococcota bacterium]
MSSQILLRLTLEEARAYWRTAGRVLDYAEPLRKARDEAPEEVDAAERAHDKLREALEPFEGRDDD